ncbi:MAG: AMP-binding protein [Rhodobacteraceae bacterium]|nr:AMP-binding protein [Paracoccaceae bacterium]
MTIYTSSFDDIALSDLTITQRVFAGLAMEDVVLVDGPSGRTFTGAQMMAAVKSLAGGLAARGLTPGKSVALMAPNLPEYCIAFHAICWAGGTATTINPTYTAPEVHHQLNDADAELLITVGPFAEMAGEAVQGTGVTEIVVIGDAPDGTTPLSALMGPPLEDQVPVDVTDHVAALPYSSGTTGLPKGVMLTHRNLVVNVDQMLANADLIPGEKTVSFLPFFHIYGLQVMMNLYLAAGAGVVTMPRFDLEMYLNLCTEYQTPRLWVVPPVALALAAHPILDTYDMSYVQQVNSAAAPLGADVSEAIAKRMGTRATQAYGLTELSPASHVSPSGYGKPGASGVNVPNTECRIVDPETLQDRPLGEDGEIWVRGPQVMKGYLKRPDATAECITTEGWFRTGDIGHYDDEGYLYITDRLKELIKYKGFQVAPAEVEAQLVTHPAIADAAVIGKPDAEAGELPMAFITPAPGQDAPSLGDVQSYLEGRLAHYKQIREMEVTDEIPKSASGKILRRFLRDRIAGG